MRSKNTIQPAIISLKLTLNLEFVELFSTNFAHRIGFLDPFVIRQKC